MSNMKPEDIKAQIASYRQGAEAIAKATARQNAPATAAAGLRHIGQK